MYINITHLHSIATKEKRILFEIITIPFLFIIMNDSHQELSFKKILRHCKKKNGISIFNPNGRPRKRTKRREKGGKEEKLMIIFNKLLWDRL